MKPRTSRWSLPIVRFALPISTAIAFVLAPAPALGWDAHGHRTITLLALDSASIALSNDPARTQLSFLFSDQGRRQAAYASSEADRYRGIRPPVGMFLAHEVNPDHYINIEDLEQFGLTLSTMPPLRNEYLRALVVAKHEHPENIKPYNEKTDPARQQEWPGFVAHAMMEHYAKLTSAFRQVRVLEQLNDPARALQLETARGFVIGELGHLSHFVGDAAQPLHTTKHHHGWVGDNPQNYTTDRGFHAYIDGTILTIHQLDHPALAAPVHKDEDPLKPRTIDINNPWADVLAHLERSFAGVEPLYALQKSGALEQAPGKQFIAERLRDGGSMLGALIAGAWNAAEPTEKDVSDFIMYDAPAKLPSAATPAPSPPAPPKP
jgi:S1/P1 Nuclease